MSLDRGGVAAQSLLAQQVAGQQRRALRRVLGQHAAGEIVADGEDRPAGDERLGALGHAAHHRVRGVDDQLEDRAGHEELVAPETGDHVLHRQVELLHRPQAARVDRHQGATGADEPVQRPRPPLAQPAGVAWWHRALGVAFADALRRDVR